MPPVPFLDLYAGNRRVENAFYRRLKSLYRASAFIGGPAVETFEREFAAAMRAPHCVAVSSGTAALQLSLIAAGIGEGDEVIIPAFTFPGAAGPVVHLGARPVFVDVQARDGCLDPVRVARAVTKKTRAILATHLFGHPANMDAMRAVVRAAKTRGHRIVLIEDAAQAHGGSWRGKALGTIGDFGCFSFYPTKNLGGLGDGGAILVKTKAHADRLRRLRDHGQSQRFQPEESGFNARMDALQATFLSLKLPELAAGNARRAAVADRYIKGLGGSGESVPEPLIPDARGISAWHACVVHSPERAALIRRLKARKIGHQIYYPAALPDLPAFREFVKKAAGARDDFPVARELARTGFAIPLHPDLRPQAVTEVLAALTP
jgi:dTDP-3-amino-3,4,6-trideoxy-alpha-D-glucose transaminase